MTVALIVPGFSTLITLGFMTGRAQEVRTYEQVLPTGTRIVLGGLAGLTGALSTDVRPLYLAPLAFVLVTIIVMDPLWRAACKHTYANTA